jgi:hypothetical protein
MSDRTAPTAYFLALSTDDLLDERDQVELDMVRIRGQIDRRKAEWSSRRAQTDYPWLASAEAALRSKGLIHQRLLREIARRSRDEKQTAQASLERCFVDAAKRRLDPVLFGELLDSARREQERKP